MTSILIPPPEQPSAQDVSILLGGLSWSAFQSLVSDLAPDTTLKLSYDAHGLQISQQPLSNQPLSNKKPSPAPISTQIVLSGVTWPTYQTLISDVGDERAWRIAYDQGVLEIRMPLAEHEEPKRLLEDFVTTVVDALDIEARSLGSLTLEREELTKAVEPDSCFYIQNEPLVRGKRIELPADPPPDLVIESDHTHSSLNKHSIYAALGVPEIWRYRQKKIEIYVLKDGSYSLVEASKTFPFVPVVEMASLIEQAKEIGQRKAVRQFRKLIQDILD